MTLPTLLAPAELLARYRDGSVTPELIMREVLARIAAYSDPAVWIAGVAAEVVLERARELQRDPAAREQLPLYGLPFAVKDNIDVAGMPTTAGCPQFAYIPDESAFVVRQILAAGAILVGKTNLDQFATGLVGTRSPYGAPRSVFDPNYISGGSSSGSAVAVAAGLCAFALGTDTAGSGRVPASFNNIVGIKPTRGALSCSGVVPACRSLDCVSVFAPSVADARAVAVVAEGFDATDPYARAAHDVGLPSGRFRCGVLAPAQREFFGDDAAAGLYAQAIERARDCGAQIVEVDFTPFRETADLLYGGAWVAERMAAIAPFFAAHADAIEPTVRTIIGGAQRYSAADAFAAYHRLRALERRAAPVWTTTDVMLLPTAPTTYTVAEVMTDPIVTNARLGTYTNFVNLLDYCAIAVPAGFRPSGLPFGVTFVAPAFCDRDLASLAARFNGEDPGLVTESGAADDSDRITIAVAGAHMSGFALNPQLTELGAAFVGSFTTGPGYRLFALANTVPPKPALVRDPDFAGSGVEVEVWALGPAAFGSFVARQPAPMAIGRVTLADGSDVAGFTCERHALAGAAEVTQYGGWRAYCAQRA